jgi:hypothetical protein
MVLRMILRVILRMILGMVLGLVLGLVVGLVLTVCGGHHALRGQRYAGKQSNREGRQPRQGNCFQGKSR